jgi:DNA-binding ferritin-like protein (Dps family)
MTQLNIYKKVAESIEKFSCHSLNKIELYEIIIDAFTQATIDKNEICELLEDGSGVCRTQYQTAKDWLKKR